MALHAAIAVPVAAVLTSTAATITNTRPRPLSTATGCTRERLSHSFSFCIFQTRGSMFRIFCGCWAMHHDTSLPPGPVLHLCPRASRHVVIMPSNRASSVAPDAEPHLWCSRAAAVNCRVFPVTSSAYVSRIVPIQRAGGQGGIARWSGARPAVKWKGVWKRFFIVPDHPSRPWPLAEEGVREEGCRVGH